MMIFLDMSRPATCDVAALKSTRDTDKVASNVCKIIITINNNNKDTRRGRGLVFRQIYSPRSAVAWLSPSTCRRSSVSSPSSSGLQNLFGGANFIAFPLEWLAGRQIQLNPALLYHPVLRRNGWHGPAMKCSTIRGLLSLYSSTV